MKAIQFQFKSSKHTIVDAPKPTPAEDEVLVKVHYSALDHTHRGVINREMLGYFTHTSSTKTPLFMGYHFSGVVEATGRQVDDFPKGSEVFGHLQYEPSQAQGAFNEYITVKKDALAKKPSSISHALAAASTTESITALQALRDHGGLKKGGSVLVNGAAGGVGSAAVQIAKKLGAHVTAICSSKDVDQVAGWGADIVINRTKEANFIENFAKEGVSFDVILDTPNVLPASLTQLLKPNGTVVYTIPTMTMLWLTIKTIFSKKRVAFVEVHSKKADLELLGEWLENDVVKIPFDSTFKVCDFEAAYKKQNGKKNGRVVIQVEGGWN